MIYKIQMLQNANFGAFDLIWILDLCLTRVEFRSLAVLLHWVELKLVLTKTVINSACILVHVS